MSSDDDDDDDDNIDRDVVIAIINLMNDATLMSFRGWTVNTVILAHRDFRLFAPYEDSYLLIYLWLNNNNSKARFPFKRNRLRYVNENRKKRKRMRWQRKRLRLNGNPA